MGNDPVNGVDPDGGWTDPIISKSVHQATQLAEVVVVGTSTANTFISEGIRAAVGIGTGFANAVTSNAGFNFRIYAPDDKYIQIGLLMGDGYSIIDGVAKMGQGLVLAAGRGTLTLTTGGVASPVSVPAAAAGVALGALGAVETGNALSNIKDSYGRVFSKKARNYPNDFPSANTNNITIKVKSEREARRIIQTRLGKNPVKLGNNKWRSQDGVWQYRAKPGDVGQGHVHLEKLDPATGEVLKNWHLEW